MLKSALRPLGISRSRQLIVLVGVISLLGLLQLGYQIWLSHQGVLQEAETKSRDYAQMLEAKFDATLRRTDAVLISVAHTTPMEALSESAVPRHAAERAVDLNLRLRTFPELTRARIFDAQGHSLYSSDDPNAPRINIAERAYFAQLQATPQTSLVYSELIRDHTSGGPAIVVARRLQDAQGQFRGAVVAIVNLAHFERLFRSLDVGPHGAVAIRRTDDNSLVVRWPPLSEATAAHVNPRAHVPQRLAAGDKSGTQHVVASSDGMARIYSFRALQNYPFYVTVGLARNDVLAAWAGRSLAIGLSALLLLGLLAVALAQLWRSDTRATQALHAIEASENRYRSVISALAEGIVLNATDGSITTANAAAERILGLSAEQMQGRQPVDPRWRAIHEDGSPFPGETHPGSVTLRTGEPQTDVVMGVHKPDGALTWISINSEPIYMPGQAKPSAVVASFADITARKQAEQALAALVSELEERVAQRTRDLDAAKQEAERANRVKSEFLSSMSHELRTPLNAILGFGQLLIANPLQPLPAPQDDYVQEILGAGRHLLELIGEVLDLASIEAGKLAVHLEPVALQALMADSLRLVQPSARERGIRIVNDGGASADAVVYADRTRLKQVLLNLLSNAVKYNRAHGRIRIAYNPAGQALRIDVTDSGPGLSAAQQARLFRDFERLGADKGGIEGTGVGLALSKRLIELMHGQIGVESQVGVGSTFWVSLPLTPAPSPAAPPSSLSSPWSAPVPPGQAKTVLYIEDDPVNIRLMSALMAQQPGIRLITARLPGAGLDLAHAEQPDLILLDLHLPGFDGFEVLRQLGTADATAGIPVIAVSANATRATIARALEAGFADYVTKPLDIAHLFEAMARAFGAREAQAH